MCHIFEERDSQQHITMPPSPTAPTLACSPPLAQSPASSGTVTPVSVVAQEVNGTTYFYPPQVQPAPNVTVPFSSYNVAPSEPVGAFVPGPLSVDGSSAASSPGPPTEFLPIPCAPHRAMVNMVPLPHVPVPYNQVLNIQIPPMPPQAASAPASPKTSITTNMEVVWHSEFDCRFRNFPQKWTLAPVSIEPEETFHSFKDSAKVRFCCKCGNGWTSMKGRVMFWFNLDVQHGMGFVFFRLYGQKCSKCNAKEFVHAMWYPEEVVKVVDNIFRRVGTVYYKFPQPSLQLNRREGKPRQQHNSDLCQACAEGVCREGFIAT